MRTVWTGALTGMPRTTWSPCSSGPSFLPCGPQERGVGGVDSGRCAIEALGRTCAQDRDLDESFHLTLDHFAKQFAHFVPGRVQRFPPGGRGPVHLAPRFSAAPQGGSKVTLLLQPMQQRVERPGTDPIAVAG